MSMLEVVNIEKQYEGQPLLKGVSFQVSSGETVCLLGRSGSGKSTLLRIIAGLEEADAGQVRWNGTDLAGIPVHRREFGLMFQDYALFPHRSVAENVAFGLKMQKLERGVIQRRVQEALKAVNLQAFAYRRVTDLSGGEQQRVALARALAPRPRLLMLDEPLGALDRTLRSTLLGELRKVLRSTGIPAIYVTHDQEEAFALADRLVLLHNGQVEQAGSPQAVYRQPASTWAAEFLGFTNLVEGIVRETRPLTIATVFGDLQPESASGCFPESGARVHVLIRPDGFRLHAPQEAAGGRRVQVADVVFRGEKFEVTVEDDGRRFTLHCGDAPRVGERLCLSVDPKEVVCLP